VSFLKGLISLSITPQSIVHPIPILAIVVFSLSGQFDLILLFKAVVLSFLFQSGVNLWNHVNDVKEDTFSGRKNMLTEREETRKIILILSLALYVTSFLLFTLWIVDNRGIIAFAAATSATWIYSDRMILGRKIRRWKDHYVTEVLAYIIAVPSFTSGLWSLFAPLSARTLVLSIIITLFMLSGVFLKDIKDITGDRLAGLKTLGVVFSPETLLKIALTLLGFYYLFVIIISFFGLLPRLSLVSALLSAGLIYALKHFMNNDWSITRESVKPVKVMVYSGIASLLIIAITAFI